MHSANDARMLASSLLWGRTKTLKDHLTTMSCPLSNIVSTGSSGIEPHPSLQGLFLVEGHWDRFHPATQAARAVINRGMIGKCVALPSCYPAAAAQPRCAHRASNTARPTASVVQPMWPDVTQRLIAPVSFFLMQDFFAQNEGRHSVATSAGRGTWRAISAWSPRRASSGCTGGSWAAARSWTSASTPCPSSRCFYLINCTTLSRIGIGISVGTLSLGNVSRDASLTSCSALVCARGCGWPAMSLQSCQACFVLPHLLWSLHADRSLAKFVLQAQYIYEGEEPTDVQASAFLKDGIDVLGSTLLKCASPIPLVFCAQMQNVSRHCPRHPAPRVCRPLNGVFNRVTPFSIAPIAECLIPRNSCTNLENSLR